MLVAGDIGDFSGGGGLRYWLKDAKDVDVGGLRQADAIVLALDPPTLFDGNSAHEAEGCTGERYTVIAWTVSTWQEMEQRDLKRLQEEMGFFIPSQVGMSRLHGAIRALDKTRS